MTSLGSEKARGPREKSLPATAHTSQPQKQIQVSNPRTRCQFVHLICSLNQCLVVLALFNRLLNLFVFLLLWQATAEQIRLAQMIYDKNDADFEDKVNQVRNTEQFLSTQWKLDLSKSNFFFF